MNKYTVTMRSEQDYFQKHMNINSHLKKLRPAHLHISRESTSRLSYVQYMSPFQSFFPNISEGVLLCNDYKCIQVDALQCGERALGLEKCNEDFNHNYATYYMTLGKSFCLPWTSICVLLSTFIT